MKIIIAGASAIGSHLARLLSRSNQDIVLIDENAPYQRLNDLVEMIGETFRTPKAGEQASWWGLQKVSDLLGNRYTNYDPKTSFAKLGNALNDRQFKFEKRRTSQRNEYKLIER